MKRIPVRCRSISPSEELFTYVNLAYNLVCLETLAQCQVGIKFKFSAYFLRLDPPFLFSRILSPNSGVLPHIINQLCDLQKKLNNEFA